MFVAKSDIISSENLSPFKVFYFLMNNFKFDHKLTDLNYNRLAILSLIILIWLLDYGLPITICTMMGLIVSIAILSQKFIWVLISIFFVFTSVLSVTSMAIWKCIVLILLSYYKLRFDQIHLSIKSIIKNGKLNIMSKRRQKRLIKLIDKHKLVSNEIHKLNLIIRNSAYAMKVMFSANRIIILYLIITTKGYFFC